MSEKMSPVEIMAKAAYESAHPQHSWLWLKANDPELAQDKIAQMRAALRAFAATEPTWEMLLMSAPVRFEKTGECAISIWRGMTLAAADIGEGEPHE